MTLLMDAAWHITKTEARYRAQGNEVDAERAHQRVLAVAARADDPSQILRDLAKRLDAVRP